MPLVKNSLLITHQLTIALFEFEQLKLVQFLILITLMIFISRGQKESVGLAKEFRKNLLPEKNVVKCT